MSSPLKDWVSYLQNFSNKLEAAYSLPYEVQDIHEDVRKYIAKITKQKKSAEKQRWQLVIIGNKVCGFRQLVIKDG